MSHSSSIIVTREKIVLPTYLPAAPDTNPMFLEKRVYQGSSGKVYPLPFTDRIAEKPVDHEWDGIWIENEYLKALVLPEIGGRIHILQDKTNGYDLIYRQDVIKPALVGLAGPWISGGIEFNWPQHHRPATFLPADVEIEHGNDGSMTIWCSDHDPLSRMKGMHGVCLRPGKARLELRARVHNRTTIPQTFLWWANVATRVNEDYQSFFPPDVYYVADHAKRATSEYPLCQGHYYGVDYGQRGRKGVPPEEYPAQYIPANCKGKSKTKYKPNDLSFYANIPVPTSYMCMGSKEDFFGGYDHGLEAGIIHLANHHISPGKKQWTWGNHEFGYAWDRNLTDLDPKGEFAPYIEIMAGVYTDNQPDFSFLQPGETKTWTQYWCPLQKIGPAHHATNDAAVCLSLDGRKLLVGVAVFADDPQALIEVLAKGKIIFSESCDLSPSSPFKKIHDLPGAVKLADLCLRVSDAQGNLLINYQPKPRVKAPVPPPATEPPAPEQITSIDELYLTGLHLEQYRHATRMPETYWKEALKRDASDSRANTAMARWHLRRGEWSDAETHARAAIARLTFRNPNPADGEAHYTLGLILIYQGKYDGAYDAFYKATWNQAWTAAGYACLAEIDCRREEWATALFHLNESLKRDTDNLRVRNLKVMVLREIGASEDARQLLQETLALDPLDWWARWLKGESLPCDTQAKLDLAHDLARAGFYSEAIRVLETKEKSTGILPDQSWGTAPLVAYTLGWLHELSGDHVVAREHFARGARLSPNYCFPSRLEEILIFEAASQANPRDPRAPYYLGNLLYDRRRHKEAIRLWEKSARLDGSFSTVWRNLGIGFFNIHGKPAQARAAYERALKAAPSDARLLFERDQLWKRLGESPAKRLREMERYLNLVAQRDDLSVELCALYNQIGKPAQALEILTKRNFQPWEGGEGQALGQYVRACLLSARSSLDGRAPEEAIESLRAALQPPRNLGEARHILANQSDVRFWLGCALAASGDKKAAQKEWTLAATFKGDFQDMSVRAFSEMTYYSALAWEKLGKKGQARKLFKDLLDYARELEKSQAKIDYFATSLPTMLLFDDDIQFRQVTTARFLQAQAALGLGRKAKGRTLLKDVLRRDPNHALAADLLVD